MHIAIRKECDFALNNINQFPFLYKNTKIHLSNNIKFMLIGNTYEPMSLYFCGIKINSNSSTI